MQILRASSGSKAANFDGFTLEVSGIAGSTRSHRVAIEGIEKVGMLPAKGEWMFGVKTAKGAFVLFVPDGQHQAWQVIADAVTAAVAALPGR
jgi:hypothetical protein